MIQKDLFSKRFLISGVQNLSFTPSTYIPLKKRKLGENRTYTCEIILNFYFTLICCLKSQVEATDKYYRTLSDMKRVLQTHSQHDPLMLTGTRDTERSSAEKRSANCITSFLSGLTKETSQDLLYQKIHFSETLTVFCELPHFDEMLSAY